MYGCSIDIGIKNLSISINKFPTFVYEELYKEYKKLPASQRKILLNNSNKTIQDIKDKISFNNEILYLSNVDLTNETNNGRVLNDVVRKNLFSHLNSLLPLLEKTHIIIIEQQYNNRKGSNMNAIKLAETCYTYCLLNLPNTIITYFPSKYKTQILNAPPKQTKLQRKKWTVNYVKVLFEVLPTKRILTTTEKDVIKLFTDSKKKDDLSDSLTQWFVFVYRSLFYLRK